MNKVLEGYNSEKKSYMVDSYPYGRMRCRIRFWMEQNNKGYRFCSQTENPKTLQWNSPKRGTYHTIACMFLDDQNHVQYSALSEYSDLKDVKSFIERFPQKNSLLKAICLRKAVYCRGLADGKIQWTINGVVQPYTEDRKLELREEANGWLECAKLVGDKNESA